MQSGNRHHVNWLLLVILSVGSRRETEILVPFRGPTEARHSRGYSFACSNFRARRSRSNSHGVEAWRFSWSAFVLARICCWAAGRRNFARGFAFAGNNPQQCISIADDRVHRSDAVDCTLYLPSGVFDLSHRTLYTALHPISNVFNAGSVQRRSCCYRAVVYQLFLCPEAGDAKRYKLISPTS